MKILGLITARGGSKGVPNKNIKLLNTYNIKSAFKEFKDKLLRYGNVNKHSWVPDRAHGCQGVVSETYWIATGLPGWVEVWGPVLRQFPSQALYPGSHSMQGALAICVPEDVKGPVAVLVQDILNPSWALIVPLIVVLNGFIQRVRWVGLDIVRDV